MTQSEIALLVMAYGGPNSLDDIEPYLLDIRGGRATPPELVEEIRERYALIGGRSPLLDITRAQAEVLAARLNAEGPYTFKPYVGMRHWFPYIREAVEQIVADGLQRVVALVMAPHYSRMSIGAYIKNVEAAVTDLGAELDITYVRQWGDHPLYIEAVARHIREALHAFAPEEHARVKLLFTAHSLPAAIMQQGDPYDAQLRTTARLVAERLGWPEDRWMFCYQSAGASNAKWLGPDINEVIPALAAEGETAILVAPVGFVADHVEILYDIDIEARQIAEEHGVHLERMASMNAEPHFVEALAAVVREHLEQAAHETA
nr:ferrochelatase [Ardenticatena sp.]